MTLLDFLLQFFIGYFMFRLALGFYKYTKEAEDHKKNRVLDHLNSIVHVVQLEKHGDQYYWFDRDDQQFLAQGATLDDIINVLKMNYKSHIFILNENEVLMGPDWKISDQKNFNIQFPFDK